MKLPTLISTLSNRPYPFERIEEFAENGEALEVAMPGIAQARVKPGRHIWERYADFMPFPFAPDLSLGEGNTPLLEAPHALRAFTGLPKLRLKNETQNPTGSFKDRGSLTCLAMARALGEAFAATVSSGNMGHSIAAYAAHAGLKALVFVPPGIPREKLLAIAMHDARVVQIEAGDYSLMKKRLAELALALQFRIVSGNNPIRVEGYKLTAFEMVEQMDGRVPDYIAVPTSAGGHIRGIFKGYRELKAAGLINRLPRMIIVQARNNSPIVSAIQQGKSHLIPFTNIHTIAQAISMGDPPGGDELIHKAGKFGWLAESVSESEILDAHRRLAAAGFFVEPSAATSAAAVRKLRAAGTIQDADQVVLILTGSGLKAMDGLAPNPSNVYRVSLENLDAELPRLVAG